MLYLTEADDLLSLSSLTFDGAATDASSNALSRGKLHSEQNFDFCGLILGMTHFRSFCMVCLSFSCFYIPPLSFYY